jgi:hypothetical protein
MGMCLMPGTLPASGSLPDPPSILSSPALPCRASSLDPPMRVSWLPAPYCTRACAARGPRGCGLMARDGHKRGLLDTSWY